MRFLNEDSLAVSASIAYYSLLCVFPFLLLLIGIGGFYFKQHDVPGRIGIILQRYLPFRPDFLVETAQTATKAFGRIGLISALLLWWSSSGIFMPLEKALNRAWDTEEQRTWFRRHLVSLEMALVIGLLFVFSSLLLGANVYVYGWIRRGTHLLPVALLTLAYHIAVVVTTFGITLAMFIVLFKGLPNRPMSFRQVFPSALLTATLWEGARSLFTLLLPAFNYRHVYGSIAVVVALMTWAYISSAVTLFGAQISQSLYRSLRPETNE